jgi:hypothetical protein
VMGRQQASVGVEIALMWPNPPLLFRQ